MVIAMGMGMTMSAHAASLQDGPEAPARAMIAAWNAHDMTALADVFTPDADWVNVVGMHWVGRDQIMFAHTAFHNTMFKANQQALVSIKARQLSPDIAILLMEAKQDAYTTPSGHQQPKALDRLTLVVVRQPTGWKIVHGQNTIVDESAAANDPVLRMPKT
jgi:uncharacterized protein (TIGR02246 family)